VNGPEASQVEASRGAVRTWFLAIALAGVCVVATLPFFADARSGARVPDAEESAAATAVIRAAFAEGDAVWVEPSWWLLPRHALEHMGPGTDAWPFPALMVSEDFDPVEAYAYRRLFVLAGFARAPSLPPELAAAGLVGTELYGGETVAVARYELGPSPRLRTLTREWPNLEVARRFAGEATPTPCRFRAGKHRCGRDSWMDVALEPRVVWRREVDWLFVHPGPQGSSLEVGWSGLQRESNSGPTWFYLRIGPTLEAVRHAEGGDVSVQVAIDGQEVDRFALDPHRFWMERRAIRMPSGAGRARVSIAIASDDPAWRETVLEADVLTELPEPLRAWATHVVE